MRVAVDATMLGPSPTGAARFVRNLLAALPEADPSLECVALVRSHIRGNESLGPRVEISAVEGGSGLAWELGGLGRAARRARANVIFKIRELVGASPLPMVVHVFEPPQYRVRWDSGGRSVKGRSKDLVLAGLLRGSLRRAARVTAGSQTTATWLREHTGVRASVVHPGIDPFFLEDPPERAMTGEQYLLHVASGDPSEDSGALLEAFASAGLSDCVLVLAGSAGRSDGPLFARANALGLAGRVRAEGRVSDARLRALYKGAVAYVHPTRYEGFGGYTALEAMSQGTPVIAFDAPGTREALEGGALLTPVGSVEALVKAMRSITDDHELHRRLSVRGHAIAEGLTWDRSAAAVLDALRAAARVT